MYLAFVCNKCIISDLDDEDGDDCIPAPCPQEFVRATGSGKAANRSRTERDSKEHPEASFRQAL
jgi:hypothetical protein